MHINHGLTRRFNPNPLIPQQIGQPSASMCLEGREKEREREKNVVVVEILLWQTQFIELHRSNLQTQLQTGDYNTTFQNNPDTQSIWLW